MGLALAFGATLPAQTKPTPKTAAPTKPAPAKQFPAKQAPAKKSGAKAEGELKYLDGVMMTIDNEVVLNSEVEDEFVAIRDGRNASLRQEGSKPLGPREERRIYNFVREKRKNAAIAARATLSLPGMKTEQIRDYVQRVLNDQEQEQIKQYGSLSKMKDELAALGHSKFMLDRRRREKVLNSLKRQERLIRLRDRTALMITPKMLRDYYRKVRKDRQTTAIVDLGLMYFPANVSDGADKAATAAKAWRSSDASTTEIAEKFGAQPLADRRDLTLKAAEKAGLRKFVLDFIATAKTGQVTDPVTQDNGTWILKLLRRGAGQKFRFNDPEVQDQLRLELLEQEIQRIEVRELIRDRRKVHIWDPHRPRRKSP